jgi:hypothetical protein
LTFSRLLGGKIPEGRTLHFLHNFLWFIDSYPAMLLLGTEAHFSLLPSTLLLGQRNKNVVLQEVLIWLPKNRN